VKSYLDIARELLPKARIRPCKGTFVRCVALQPLIASGQPNYLFTSGKANRFNPPAVDCIYFSEDEQIARAEYTYSLLPGATFQPIGMFFAKVSFSAFLDLEDEQTLRALKLEDSALYLSWRRSAGPTKAQLLGQAVSEQTKICAIRYPSQAAWRKGLNGFNYAIFRNSVQKPDSIQILGPTRKTLQKWP
jgi:hypothetical protein